MVNSESVDSPGDGKAKDCVTQLNSVSVGSLSPSPVTASTLYLRKMDFSNEAANISTSECCGNSMDVLPETAAITGNVQDEDDDGEERSRFSTTENISSLYCSVPLNKVQDILNTYTINLNGQTSDVIKNKKLSRKLLCLYCDRTFVTTNLRQKHVDRCHSEKQARRSSSRFQQSQSTTACIFCNKLNNVEHNLKQLFKHLVEEHSKKYFACSNCEERFLFKSHLEEHNFEIHDIFSAEIPEVSEDKAKNFETTEGEKPKLNGAIISHNLYDAESSENQDKEKTNLIKSKHKTKIKKMTTQIETNLNRPNLRMGVRKELRKKKVTVKSTKVGVKRNTRLQAKITQSKPTKKRSKNNKNDKINNTETNEKSSNSINPYPTFDAYFRVKKITDHSIDNLKISSLTFDDVFDKAFYNRIKCNIQENLQNHIDGKLFKNEESENRISNFEKMQEINNSPSENFGCDISLNAATPVVALLSTQFGEDLESQIEYGSKASKKKLPPKNDEIHYKYFTRRKYQASILESKENRDLSKLDMWTQLLVKNRQQNIINEKKTDKEKLEYTKGDEYRTKMQNEELNRILDRRGPFEDLKEEANKKAALEKYKRLGEDVSCEAITDVASILNEMLENVFDKCTNDEIKIEAFSGVEKVLDVKHCNLYKDCGEIPHYLKLKRASLVDEPDIDKSDRITLICSSQETENFEESNIPRDKNSLVELTGEWARTRIYICAACGLKLPNIKQLIDHKSVFHQNAWVQHYEFVGNQSELYKHLSIPGLGKVGYVEDFPMSKTWTRSEARICTKCSKTCNSLSELHRHILECGEDWSWMLARKKLKYRPFGAKSRRKRRGLVKRIINKEKSGDQVREKKKYNIKRIDGPRQKPSDAETIQRMLANLPAKRATRKLISLKDGFPRNIKRKSQSPKVADVSVTSKSNLITKKNKKSLQSREQLIKTNTRKKHAKCNPIMLRKSVRNINKVFGTKLLDTNSTLLVKRKLKNVFQHQRMTRSKNVSNNLSVGPVTKCETNVKESFLTKVKMLGKTVAKNVLKNTKIKNDDNSDKNHVGAAKAMRTTRSLLKKECVNNDDKEVYLDGVSKIETNDENLCDNVEAVEKKESNNLDSIGITCGTENLEPAKEIAKKESIGAKFFRTLNLKRLKKNKSEDENSKTNILPNISHRRINDLEPNLKNRKRKSLNSFRNKLKKIKLRDRHITSIVQVDGSSQISDEIPKILPFLEKIHINDQDDKMDNETEERKQSENEKLPDTNTNNTIELEPPTVSVTNFCVEENTADKEILPDVVIKQEVLINDSENCNNNHLLPNVCLKKLESTKIVNKTKIKKRIKGLNDCIAMLTSKLQQKFEDKELLETFSENTQENHDFIATVTGNSEHNLKQIQSDIDHTSSNIEMNSLQHTDPNTTNHNFDNGNDRENISNICENNNKESEEERVKIDKCERVNQVEPTNKDFISETDIPHCGMEIIPENTEIINNILNNDKKINENNDEMCINKNLYEDDYNVKEKKMDDSENNCKTKSFNKLENINKSVIDGTSINLLDVPSDINDKLYENHERRHNLASLKFKEIVNQNNDLAILMDKFNDVDIKNKFKEVDVNIEIDIMKCLEHVADNVITMTDNQKHFKKRVKNHLKKKQNHKFGSIRKFNNKRKENIALVTNKLDAVVKCDGVLVNGSQNENDLTTPAIENCEYVLHESMKESDVEINATTKEINCENVSNELNLETNKNALLFNVDKQVSVNVDLPNIFNGIDATIQDNKTWTKKAKKKKKQSAIQETTSILTEEPEPDVLENKSIDEPQFVECVSIIPISNHEILTKVDTPEKKIETDSEDEVPLSLLIKTTEVKAPLNTIQETIETVIMNHASGDYVNIEKKNTDKKKKNTTKKKKSVTEKNQKDLLLHVEETTFDSKTSYDQTEEFENKNEHENKLKISCKIFQKKNKNTSLNNKMNIQYYNQVEQIEEKLQAKTYEHKNKSVSLENTQDIQCFNQAEQTEENLQAENYKNNIEEYVTDMELPPNINENGFDSSTDFKSDFQIQKDFPVDEMVSNLELEIRKRIQLSNQLLQLEKGQRSEDPVYPAAKQTNNLQEQIEENELSKEFEDNVTDFKIIQDNTKELNNEEVKEDKKQSNYEEFEINNEQTWGANKMKICKKKNTVNGEEVENFKAMTDKKKSKKNQRKHSGCSHLNTNFRKNKSRKKKLLEENNTVMVDVETSVLQTDPTTVDNENNIDMYEDVNMEIEDFHIDSQIQIGRAGQTYSPLIYENLNKEENIFEIQNAEIGRKLTINKKKLQKTDFLEQSTIPLQMEDLKNNFISSLRYEPCMEENICLDVGIDDKNNKLEIENPFEQLSTEILYESDDSKNLTGPPAYINEVKMQKKKTQKIKNKVIDTDQMDAHENECQNYSDLKITIDLSNISNIPEINTNLELTKQKKKKKCMYSLDMNPCVAFLSKNTNISEIYTTTDNTYDTNNISNMFTDKNILLNEEMNLDIVNNKNININQGGSNIISSDLSDSNNDLCTVTSVKENHCVQSFVIPTLNQKPSKKVKKNRKQKNASLIDVNDEQNVTPPTNTKEHNDLDVESATNEKLTQSADDIFTQNSNSKQVFKNKGGTRKTEKKKRSNTEKSDQLYCEICDRYFARCDNLLKHKRTLTHIAKLSEIEANEAATKINGEQENEDAFKMNINISDILNKPEKDPELNNDITNKIHINSPFMIKTNSDTLKLADIINDVLNKPVDGDTIKQTFCESATSVAIPNVKETKRYKSLGERKSFESDLNSTYTFNNLQVNDEISTPKLPNTTDSILKHQISILENIIENQGPFGYIDDLSISSNKSIERLSEHSEFELSESKQDNLNQIAFTHSTSIINSLIKPGIHGDNFIKPTQYEEISNDSSSVRNNFDDQRSRKVLNRDEELFLECCSLLKSSSEVSSYSKRSSKTISVLNNFELLKPSDEPDWLENKGFVAKNQEFRNEVYSDSCPNTPLGDGFGDDHSNSNSHIIGADWSNKDQQRFNENPAFEDISVDSKESSINHQKDKINQINENNFKDAFSAEKNIFIDDKHVEEQDNEVNLLVNHDNIKEIDDDLKKKMVTRFDGLMAKALKNSLQVITKPKNKKKQLPDVTQTSIMDYTVPISTNKVEADIYDSKKMLTKGAMKVFEGLKVSIPTDDFDIKKLLNGTFIPGKEKEDVPLESTAPNKELLVQSKDELQSSKIDLRKCGNKLGLKVTKKKHVLKQTSNLKETKKNENQKQEENKKTHDVYDFEETQDNTDIFNSATFTNLTTFRSQIAEKKTINEPSINKDVDVLESDSESNRYVESFNFEAQSVSSFSAESTISVKKPKQKNITKNKCMIMGRIFKNAFKSKVEDDIRDIPTVENTKLVEDYVMQLPEETVKKNKMSEDEMNLLFDKLLQDKDMNENSEKKLPTGKVDVKTINGKAPLKGKKTLMKRKRPRHNSESTDDEFNINKTRKRYTKKKHKNMDNGINLEQELKECIGVASRKSQRKCTSGKQNVLVEFWSSDESMFEALLVEDVLVTKTPKIDYSVESLDKVKSKEVNVQEEPILQPLEPEIQTVAPNLEMEKSKASKNEKAAGVKQVRRKSVAKHNRSKHDEDKEDIKLKHIKVTAETLAANRRKRAAADTLYYWSSSSEDESQDLIEVKPIRDEVDEDDDRPMQHGWIVGDSPKKLVTMLAQAKGKKVDAVCVKEQSKKRTTM